MKPKKTTIREKKIIKRADTDTFMKVIAPSSKLIVKKLSPVLVGSGTLSLQKALPTELSSRAIAEALHRKGRFKLGRADGIFMSQLDQNGTKTEGPVICIEYQSTPNVGMILRQIFDEVSFRECYPEYAKGREMQHILVLSGKGHPKEFTDNHGKVIENRIRVGVIDLEQIEDLEFDMTNPGDVCLRLAKSSITASNEFLNAIDLVTNTMNDDVQKDRFLHAIVLMAASKGKNILDDIKENHMSNDEVRKVLKEVLEPTLAPEVLEDKRREGKIEGKIELIIDALPDERRSSNNEAALSRMSSDELNAVWSQIKMAMKTDDWSKIDEILPSQPTFKP